MYCTYLTIYRGNKLPPFYIGHAKISNITNKDYRGSVSSKKYKEIWKSELLNYPNLFNIHILRIFETKKEAHLHENKLLRHVNAHLNPMYINEHISSDDFFNPKWGTQNFKGVKNPFYGKTHTEKTKKLMSKSRIEWYKRTGGYSKETLELWSKNRSGKMVAKDSITGEIAGVVPINHPDVISGKLVHIMLGHKYDDDYKSKISASKLGNKNPSYGKKGELSPNFGLKRTDESRLKMKEHHALRKQFSKISGIPYRKVTRDLLEFQQWIMLRKQYN